MMEWPRVQLKNIVVDLQPGFACQPTDDPDGVPQLRTNNVSPDGRVDLSAMKRVPANGAQIEKYSLKPSDVLFNNTNSPALVGKTAVFDEDGLFLFSNHMTRIRFVPEVVEPRYVARYLHWAWSQGTFRALITQWVNQAAINRNQLLSVRVSLPPLSEQRRIVEILNQADRLRRLRTEADAKTDRLLSTLFVKMFGDPATNSKGWPKRPLDELATVTTGNTPSRKRPEYYGNFIEWIKSDNLNTVSHYVTPATERLSELGAKIARTVPSGSTLVTCIAGSLSAIGNAALADRRVAFNQQINAATPKEGIDSYFLYGHFVVGKRLVQEASTGGMKGLVSKSRFSRIAFLKPPFDLQEHFGHHCRKLCKQNRARLRQDFQFGSLFATLLHRAFSGDLTTSWREAHMKELVQEMEQQARLLS